MAMFDEIGGLLSSGSMLAKFGPLLGGDDSKTQKAIGGAVPLLLGALGKRSGSAAGAAGLFSLLQGAGDNGGMLDKIGDMFGGDDSMVGGLLDKVGGLFGNDDDDDKGGNELVGSLLGGRRSAVEEGLASHAGLPVGSIAKFLPMVAPMILGFLNKKRKADNLDASGVATLLGGERKAMESAGHGGLLGLLDGGDDEADGAGFLSGLKKYAGMAGIAAAIPGAGAILGKVTGGAADVTAKVTGAANAAGGAISGAAGAATGAAKGAADAASNTVKGAAGVATGAAAAATGAAKGAAGAASNTVKGAAGVATGAAGAAMAKAASTTSQIRTEATEQKKKKGLLWLLPLILVAGLAALLLSKCGKDDDTPVAADTTISAEATDVVVAESTPAETVAAETVATETVATETVAAAVETTVAAAASGATTNILETATAAGNFKTLAAAVAASGVGEALNGPGPFTIFAPTDEAFAKLPKGVAAALMLPENKDKLDMVLKYHALSGAVSSSAIASGDVPSLEGSPLSLTADGGKVTIKNGAGVANVITADIAASNGVIHAIDQVLIPASLDLSTIVNASGDATPEGRTIYFASGSAAIDAEGQAKVAQLVEEIKTKAVTKVAATGHADSNGDPVKNKALSERRAQAVADAIKAGLGDAGSAVTFTVDAKGDTDQQENLEKSRRVTVEVAQ